MKLKKIKQIILKIILSQKRNSITKNQYTSSLSNPDIFTSPNDYTSNNNETEEELKNKAKRHYMDIIHTKNEQILKEYKIKKKRKKKKNKKYRCKKSKKKKKKKKKK